jgi:hypothetical protein
MNDVDIIYLSKAVLETTPEHWRQLTLTLPTALLTRAPAPGEWSALECLQHIVDTERQVFPVRVRHLMAGEDFPGFDPDAQGMRPETPPEPVALAEDFAALRAENLQLWDSISESDLERRARHSELGEVTLRELLNTWAGHDLMHTVQAERPMMQPFIEGCGPWRPLYADHIAGSGE